MFRKAMIGAFAVALAAAVPNVASARAGGGHHGGFHGGGFLSQSCLTAECRLVAYFNAAHTPAVRCPHSPRGEIASAAVIAVAPVIGTVSKRCGG